MGVEIPGYEVDGMLGAGGFGAVYRARRHDGHEVALKVSHDRAANLRTREAVSWLNEAESLRRLDHPGLVGLLDFGYLPGGRIYLAMELAVGTPLDEHLLRRGRLDVVEAVAVTARVAEAVAYCHRRGVLHLDLKPQNILLTDPVAPQVKVLDFGLAQLSAAWRGASGVAGTPAYMAPESFLGGADSERADQYALGVILYELISGRWPFDCANPSGLRDAKLAGALVPLAQAVPGAPASIASLVERLLAREPRARYGSVDELVRELERLGYAILSGAPRRRAGSVAAAMPALSDEPVPFVGRAAELRVLDQALARRGGETISIVGDVGVGKSRLCSVLLDRAVEAGFSVGYGRGRALPGIEPFLPLREAISTIAERSVALAGAELDALRARLAGRLRGDGALLEALVPESRPLLGELRGDAAPAPPEELDARVVADLTALLTTLGEVAPFLLVVEDLHWLDAATRAVLAGLAHRLPATGLLVVTGRSGARHALPGSSRELALGELDGADHLALLAALVPGLARSGVDRLQRAVPLLRVGNPLFTIQTVRHLSHEGCFLRRGGRVLLDEERLTRRPPPDSVIEVIDRLIERVPSRSRTVLAVGALLGPRFELVDVASLGLFDDLQVAAAAFDGVRGHLCSLDGGRCTITHEMARARLVATLSPLQLPEAHERIARRLRERGAPARDLAWHLDRAGDGLAAAAAYLDAARRADRLCAGAEVVATLGRALALLEDEPDVHERNELAVQVTVELVRLAAAIEGSERTLGYVDRCLRLLGEPLPQHRAAIEASLARVHYVRGDFARAREHAVRCISQAAASGEPQRYQASPLNILGRSQAASGKFAAAAAALERGCAIAEARGELAELAHSTGMLGLCLGYRGEFDRARACLDRGWELSRRLGDPTREVAALAYYAVFAEASFDCEAGRHYSTEALRHAERQEVGGLYRYLATLFAGRHQFHAGERGRARALLERAVAMAENLAVAMGLGWAHGFLGDLDFVEGRLPDAAAHYRRALAIGNAALGDEYAAPLGAIGLAHCAARTGGPLLEVHRLAGEALERLDRAGNRCTPVHVLERYAEALEELEVDPRPWRHRRADAAAALGIDPTTWWPRRNDTGRARAARAPVSPLFARRRPSVEVTRPARPRAPAPVARG